MAFELFRSLRITINGKFYLKQVEPETAKISILSIKETCAYIKTLNELQLLHIVRTKHDAHKKMDMRTLCCIIGYQAVKRDTNYQGCSSKPFVAKKVRTK